MSILKTRLGYGKEAMIEMDNFTRIMACQFWDSEEVRYDRPDIYTNNWAYVGVAPIGASISDPVWMCIRRSYDGNGKCYRDQFRDNIAWIYRADGWL